MKILIGIDIGTSATKVSAIDENVNLLADATEEYPCFYPQTGWSEQNPEDWWKAAVNGLNSVIKELDNGDKYDIAAIGLSGQMHGAVLLGENLQVIRPAILWNDQRTVSQCKKITEKAGGEAEMIRRTGNPQLTGYQAGKILWVKENEPENYKKIRHILCPKDYIRFMLTGEFITDYSDASGTGLFDVKNRSFDIELIKKVGFDPSFFPKAVESTEVAGFISKKAEKITGIKAGTPVSGGGGDAVIANVGLGLTIPSKAAVTIGTSGVVSVGLDGFCENKGGKLQVFCSVIPNSWHAMGAALTAAGAYKWFAEDFCSDGGKLPENIYKTLDNEALKVAPGCDGLMFLPFLAGERCPYYDPDAKGVFIGISGGHKKGHFARAIMEGVAFSLRSVYELVCKTANVSSDEIILAGGGASSPLWRQITADVFGRAVVTVKGSEQGGSYAAALTAGVTVGVWKSLEETSGMISVKSINKPDKQMTEIYENRFGKYMKLYDSLKWYWK